MSNTEKKENPAPEESGRFIGPRKVELAIATEYKTHAGADVIEVVYAGGHKELMPRLAFEYLVTEQPTDWNQLRKTKMGVLTKELLAVIAEHDLKAADIETLKQSLENELYNSFNRATHFLWTKDDKSFIPGNNVVMDRSLLEADIIIKTVPTDESKPETTESAGENPTGEQSA